MTEQKTTFVLEGKARGFPQVQAEVQRLTGTAAKAVAQQSKDFESMVKKGQGYVTMWSRMRSSAGFPKLAGEAAGYAKQVTDLTKKLEGLANQQVATLREMEGTDAASDAYKELAKNLDHVRDRTSKVREEMRALREANKQAAAEVERYTRDRAQGRGAFSQGLLQGALPGGLIQRGPGALQQAAGTAIGAGARGLAYDRPRTILGGLASSPFTGISGIAQGLAGIPVVGGMLAGQLQTTAGFAGMALQRQSMLRGLAPQLGAGFLPTGPSDAQIAKAQGAILAREYKNLKFPSKVPSDVTRRILELRAGGTEVSSAGVSPWGMGIKEKTPMPWAGAGDQAVTEWKGRQAAAAAGPKMQAVGAAMRGQRRGGVEGAIRAAGLTYGGLSALESTQFAGALSTVGGGTMADLRGQDMLGTAVAAQTKYGVGADVSGQFLRGMRRGGIAGEQGQTAGGVLTRTLADAVELGLKGSEVQEYMRTVAQGISQFQTTGIPFNPRSLKEMTLGLRDAGLAPTRAQTVAQGLTGAAQGIAQRGVQSALDVVMMQTLGGARGGGLQGYIQSMQKLESEGVKGPEMGKLFKVLMGSGGGGAAGQITFHSAMQRMGIPVSWEETGLMQRQAEGRLTDDDRKRLESLQKEWEQGPESAKDLQEQAASLIKQIAPGLKRQSDIQNQQLDVGGKMLGAVQNMEKAAVNINSTFAKEVGPPLTKLTEGILTLTQQVPEIIALVKEFLHRRAPEYK